MEWFTDTNQNFQLSWWLRDITQMKQSVIPHEILMRAPLPSSESGKFCVFYETQSIKISTFLNTATASASFMLM